MNLSKSSQGIENYLTLAFVGAIVLLSACASQSKEPVWEEGLIQPPVGTPSSDFRGTTRRVGRTELRDLPK